jgi:aryl-alcohol dehydrogenase-like predicted oxidoreductase
MSLPMEWIPVGEWTIRDNVVCGGDTVTFFAVGANEARQVSENLRSFSNRLPKDVGWRDLTGER